MLRVEQQGEKFSGPFAKVRAHHFNYGSFGEQPQGIWRVIRGGSNPIFRVGQDVIGHEHVDTDFVDTISFGQTIATTYPGTKDKRISVKLNLVEGLAPLETNSEHAMISQVGEDEVGYLFCGTIVEISDTWAGS